MRSESRNEAVRARLQRIVSEPFPPSTVRKVSLGGSFRLIFYLRDHFIYRGVMVVHLEAAHNLLTVQSQRFLHDMTVVNGRSRNSIELRPPAAQV